MKEGRTTKIRETYAQCCGSGPGAFLTPGSGIRDRQIVRIQMNNTDHISESLETVILG
jgi:hypothetical protein